MTFVPSFNNAYVSAQGFGLGTQRVMAGIDPNDVMDNLATRTLASIPMQQFKAESALAKQALAEYGATLREKERADANLVIQKMNEEQNKRTAAMNIIRGNATNVSSLLGGQVDTRAEMTRQGQYRNTAQQQDDSFYGGGELSLENVTREVLKKLGNLSAGNPTANPQTPQIKIEPPAVPKLKTPEAAMPDYTTLLNTLIQQQQGKK